MVFLLHKSEIHQHLTSVGLMFFYLQVFLKVAEEAGAEEEGIITK